MYNPAIITFPPEIRTVMIVNNAAQQPDNIGHLNYQSNADSTLSISTDSMAYFFCHALGTAIAESPLYDDVRLCDDAFRSDSIFNMIRPFTASKVEAICDEYDVDALISLDKLYFKTVLFNTLVYRMNFMTVEIIGELRMLYPRSQVAHTVPFTDSIRLSYIDMYYPYYVDFTIQDAKDAMRFLSEYTGENMKKYFVPYWISDKRWYYTNISAGWKRAAAYAGSEKWEAAANEWHYLYGATSKWRPKALLASNLALYHEITGDFNKAIEYAEIAYKFFEENVSEDDRHRKKQYEYLELLRERAEDDKKLSQQLREE